MKSKKMKVNKQPEDWTSTKERNATTKIWNYKNVMHFKWMKSKSVMFKLIYCSYEMETFQSCSLSTYMCNAHTIRFGNLSARNQPVLGYILCGSVIIKWKRTRLNGQRTDECYLFVGLTFVLVEASPLCYTWLVLFHLYIILHIFVLKCCPSLS